MAYVPIASQDTEPTDSRMAGTAAREFRTLKAYLGGLVTTVNGLNTRVATLEGGGGGGGGGAMPFISAAAYGVVADGTDKSAQLQLAIDAAKALNGVVYLPPGRIGIGTLGVQSGNVRLQGFGDTCLVGSFRYTDLTFQPSADTLTPVTRTSPFFYSDGVSYESTGDFALQLTANEQPAFISTCSLRNAKFYGPKGAKFVHIIGFDVTACEFNNTVAGLELQGCVNGTFIGNRWQNQAYYGVWIKSAGGFRNGGENMRFTNCEWAVCTHGLLVEKHMWLTVNSCLFDYCDAPVWLMGSNFAKITQSYLGASTVCRDKFGSVAGYVPAPHYGIALYLRPDSTGNFSSAVHATDCEFINYANSSTLPIVYIDGYADAGHPNSIEDVKIFNCLFLVSPATVNSTTLLTITSAKQAHVIGNTFHCYNQSAVLSSAYNLNAVMSGLAHSNQFYHCRVGGNVVGSSSERNFTATYITGADPGAVGAGALWVTP